MSLYTQVIFLKRLCEISTEAPQISLLILECTQHTAARLCFQLTVEPQLFLRVTHQPGLSELVNVHPLPASSSHSDCSDPSARFLNSISTSTHLSGN